MPPGGASCKNVIIKYYILPMSSISIFINQQPSYEITDLNCPEMFNATLIICLNKELFYAQAFLCLSDSCFKACNLS